MEYNVPFAGVAVPAESPGVHSTVQEKHQSWPGRRIPTSKLGPLHLFWDSTLPYPPRLLCNEVAVVTYIIIYPLTRDEVEVKCSLGVHKL